MLNKSKIKILMSTYNGEKYLEEQLDSIFNQTEKNFELIIRDDGSKDNTKTILEKYKKKYSEKIKIIYGENIGAKNSFFNLINSVNLDSEYYSFADQDDIWLEFKLEIAIKEIEKKRESIEESIVYCSNYTFVDKNLKILKDGHDFNEISNYKLELKNSKFQSMMLGCTIVFTKEFLKKLKMVGENYDNILMHDCWCYLVASKFSKIIFDKNKTLLYRQHGNNVSANEINFYKKIIKIKERIKKKDLFDRREQSKKFLNLYKEELTQSEIEDLTKYIEKVSFCDRLVNILEKNIVINKINRTTKLSGYINYLLFNA